jgi:hypothetical protein
METHKAQSIPQAFGAALAMLRGSSYSPHQIATIRAGLAVAYRVLGRLAVR